ncbi:hypothetical protein [Cellulosimicrobium composti]|uniref:hypothetical protein n=1 Tax=Cellulosimicrobium composti TaxID=2672572 RepID=UPI000A08D1B1|nr:hypothetical protein [Cellulosimicrobium composti]SMF10535.1 hypothetical protein SAMN02744115_01410 [Cellulosimicrobium cellulans J1]
MRQPFPAPDPRGTRAHRLRRAAASVGLVALTAGALVTPSVTSVAAEDVEVLQVDLSASTGAVQGGASGMLYGLGDDGVPTDPIVAGAHPTNVTQKAPHGAQHPNGDPLDVERSLFENGGDYLMVNIQDYYPDWPYNGGQRPEDFDSYLDIVRTVVTSIVEESDHPERYVFTPFNEPDGINWYSGWGTMGDTFLADWEAAYTTIKEIYPEARIAGPGDAWWHGESTRDILTFAKANDVLPDIWTWHELGVENLATFRSHLAEFRQIEQEVGVGPLPVNITEYAMRRDMGVPGQLVQWLAMFEDEKVDAQTAYWTYAGNLNDNMAKNNSANGAWWLLKWYGDLTGETVELTPPALDVVDTLQGIAALDADARRATVLFGGGSRDVRVEIEGVDTDLLGETVDVQVRRAAFSGQEGEALAPPVVVAERVDVVDGTVTVDVPNGDRHSAYQVVLTPALDEQPVVDPTWTAQVQAEATQLSGLTVVDRPAGDAWTFAASGAKDVRGFTSASSSLTWSVDVPTTGTYRLSVIAAVNGPSVGPGSHALFVDGEQAGTIRYEAGFSDAYRGKAEVLVDLEAGTRELSVRASADGSTLLPGANVALDRLDLERVDGPDTTVYPAHLARLDGTVPSYDGERPGSVELHGDATATFYVAARDTGYYDVTLDYAADAPASVGLLLNGREVAGLGADAPGERTSTARVHLAKGITELTVSSPDGVRLTSLTTVRAADADDAAAPVEAEDVLALAGGARLESVSQPTDVSGLQVAWLGGSAESVAVWERPEGLGAGQYDLVVRYANAEKNTGHAYNTDVVSRFLDVTEEGGSTTRGAFRHNYSWKGFWTHTIALDLATDDGALTLGNATGWAPNLDTLALAPLVLDVSNEDPQTGVALDVTVQPRCLAGTAYLAVRATNGGDAPVDVAVDTPFGGREFAGVAPGAAAYQSFSARSTGLDAGSVTVTGTADGGSGSQDVAFDALDCA